jgi:hypothetical protein
VPNLDSFKVQTQAEVENVIKSCANKTISLDTIPTALLKNNTVLSEILQFITELVNTSLSTGAFPDDLNCALVTTRLKKTRTWYENFQ